ncbi:hypothetical protein AcW1_000547 [Taiwanofungus camphoratus]|nr:hypothetical protein AcV5_004447 [Antrodia cinnamomea]KAI0963482.1 hypothetical protein AcW1_000547 [Antrodia cinnamomea]
MCHHMVHMVLVFCLIVVLFVVAHHVPFFCFFYSRFGPFVFVYVATISIFGASTFRIFYRYCLFHLSRLDFAFALSSVYNTRTPRISFVSSHLASFDFVSFPLAYVPLAAPQSGQRAKTENRKVSNIRGTYDTRFIDCQSSL